MLAFNIRQSIVLTLILLVLILAVLPPKKLKIYVYNLPKVRRLKLIFSHEKYTTELLNQPHYYGGNCEENMYGVEVYIHKAILASPWYTSDPNEATLFYIPWYQACHIHTNTTMEVNKATDVLFNHIKMDYPWWNRTRGRNHFMVLAHDRGAQSVYTKPTEYDASHRFDHTIELPNAFFIVITSTKDFYFKPGRDVAIPPLTPKGFLDFRGVEKVEPAQRTVFASFKGVIPEVSNWNYSRGIRQHLYATRNSTGFDVYGAWGGIGDDDPKGLSYGDYMVRSHFCLCPPGLVAWTPRPFNAMISGCIPVLLADLYYLPFRDLVDYNSFAIKVAEERIDDLPKILKKTFKNERKMERLRDNLKQVYPIFTYDTPIDYEKGLMWALGRELQKRLYQ